MAFWLGLKSRNARSDDEEYEAEYDEEEDWEEDEEEDWEDEEGVDWSDAWDEDGDGEVSASEFSKSVSFGVLAMLPLLLSYEWALQATRGTPHGTRSIAEAIMSVPLRPLGEENASAVRLGSILLLSLWALVGSFRRCVPVVPKLVRVLAEGALGAVLLGPLLAMTAEAAAPSSGP